MILLNDILNLPSPRNVRLRFNVSFGTNRPAIDYFTDNTVASTKHMLEGMYWNYDKKSNFSVGNITLGFLKMPSRENCWLWGIRKVSICWLTAKRGRNTLVPPMEMTCFSDAGRTIFRLVTAETNS